MDSQQKWDIFGDGTETITNGPFSEPEVRELLKDEPNWYAMVVATGDTIDSSDGPVTIGRQHL